MKTAKVFMTGRSQAVRLPKDYRFDVAEVEVWREGETVLLRPVKASRWPTGFWRQVRIDDSHFSRPAQPATQQRRLPGDR